jgi:hypothetical protein
MAKTNVREGEFEMELPCAAIRRECAVLVGKRDAKLNDFQHVNVGFHGLIVEVGGGFEGSYGTNEDAGEFGVLERSKSSESTNVRRKRRARECTMAT